MIKIFRGTEPSIRSHFDPLFTQSQRGLWIEETDGIRRYWSGFRQMLPQLRTHLGNEAVEAALSRHRIVAGLLLGHLREGFTPEEMIQVEELKAKTTSHLSHNWFLDRPVLHGLAAILNELFSQAPLQIFIPNVNLVDYVTFSLYITIQRWAPDTLPDLYVGIPSDTLPTEVDDNGVAWEYANEKVRGVLALLQTISTREEHDLSAAPAPVFEAFKRPHAAVLDLLDDDPDGKAENLLRSPEPLGDEDVAQVMVGIERAFEVFTRDVALRLTLELFDRKPRLTRRQAATLHGIAGLAAHNWQFSSSEGDARLTEFLEHHFRQALAMEDDPVLRLCLFYRLAVTLGRRKKDLSAALEAADLAISEAQNADIPKETKIYQEIWARNIRAYIYMRQGLIQEAFHDSETSLSLIEPLTSQQNVSRDIRFTRTVLADNNQALCRIAGELEKLEVRTRKNFELIEQDPESFGGRFSAPPWIFHYRRRHQLDLAIRAAHYGLSDAGRDYPHFRWYFLSQLGDLHYRKGDAKSALAYFEQTEPLRRDLRGVQNMAFLSLAVAAFRAGDYDRASQDLLRALSHPQSAAATVRAEILGMLSVIAAYRGDERASEQYINEAIDHALEEGVRDNLVRIARLAGTAAQKLGRRDEASEAYQRGLDIAKVEGTGGPPPGDLAALLIGLMECEGQDPDHVVQALHVMPEALKEDSDCWWELSRLLPLLNDSLKNSTSSFLEERESSLGEIVTAASQRSDCTAELSRLREFIPGSVYQGQMTF